jgi:hypothetical protein
MVSGREGLFVFLIGDEAFRGFECDTGYASKHGTRLVTHPIGAAQLLKLKNEIAVRGQGRISKIQVLRRLDDGNLLLFSRQTIQNFDAIAFTEANQPLS